jgi:S-adenosylmethionine decarboxylase
MNDLKSDHFKRDARGTVYAGDHLLVEMWDARALTDVTLIREALETAARAAGATVLFSHFHPFGEGLGVSGVSILAESHISIHTWPERGYAAIDVFMCGSCDPSLTVPVLEAAFAPGRNETRLILRGIEPAGAFQSVA